MLAFTSSDQFSKRRVPAHLPRILVVGAGAVGSWTALELQRRGAAVTLLDPWGPGNERSGSGGESRIIRCAYGPDEIYVELVIRAFARWRELEVAAARRLYTETGLLWLFKGDDGYARSSRDALQSRGLEFEQLAPAEAQDRFPQFSLEGIDSIYFEPQAGVLAASKATRAVRDAFVAEGGRYQPGMACPLEEDAALLSQIETEDGIAIDADAFVLAAGAWLPKLAPKALGHLIQPSRQEVYFLEAPEPKGLSKGLGAAEFPAWLYFDDNMSYGLPDLGSSGCKVGDDTRGDDFDHNDPDGGDRRPTDHGLEKLRRLLARHLPLLAEGRHLGTRVCQYENTPDGGLILDRHPALDNVWIAGGSSGHAFKLAPAIGGLAADQILESKSARPEFSIGRFSDMPAGLRSQYES